jgi:hypothetical protein
VPSSRKKNKQVDPFARLASEFCRFLGSSAKLQRERIVLRSAEMLPQLYSAVMKLPRLRCGHPPARIASAPRLDRALGRKLRDWNGYWEYFSPGDRLSSVAGNLADDLADVYADLRLGLDARRRCDGCAVHEWTNNLVHWGEHATSALRVLHSLIIEHRLI